MPRLALVRHSSLVLLLEIHFCGFTVRAGKKVSIKDGVTDRAKSVSDGMEESRNDDCKLLQLPNTS